MLLKVEAPSTFCNKKVAHVGGNTCKNRSATRNATLCDRFHDFVAPITSLSLILVRGEFKRGFDKSLSVELSAYKGVCSERCDCTFSGQFLLVRLIRKFFLLLNLKKFFKYVTSDSYTRNVVTVEFIREIKKKWTVQGSKMVSVLKTSYCYSHD